MNKFRKSQPKSRCFFTNKRFHAGLCDSNHKKRRQKSFTIPSRCANGFLCLEIPICIFNFYKERVNEKVL